MTCPHYTEGVHPDYCVFCREEELCADNERLRAALQRIADMCPATHELTLAHEMADNAMAALEPKP